MNLDQISTTSNLAPLENPVLVDSRGRALVPSPFRPSFRSYIPISAGITADWAPMGGGNALLVLWAGTEKDPSDKSIAIALERANLQQLILDLVSIDKQLGDM